jgi:multiple sugar transport system ATP-binding protein
MADVTLESVDKVYPDGTHAVEDLSIDIEDGEFIILVGPSGCGKTTALRMVAGLEEITDGKIMIGDRIVNDLPPKERDIAMVFQNYALYPHLTVRENIGFGLKLRKTPKEELKQRVEEAAQILGIDELLDRKPKALSGGQRQRVAMGRAIVREPQAFLMDEPLSNLDAKLRVQMRGEVLRIQRELGVTTIYVTHDQTEAMTMGDRVAVMRKGLLQQCAAPQTLYDEPVNLFVAGFIGSPEMNMVEGQLHVDDDAAHVSFGDQRLRIDDEVLEKRPRLRAMDQENVILGIRPEDLEDASIETEAPEDQRMKAEVDLTEAMGSEIYVHFELNAPRVMTEDTKELLADRGEGAQDIAEAAEEQAHFIGRFDPMSRVDVGDEVEIAVDTRRLHFFEPVSGASIFDGENR